jgi:hypothetical protein
VSLAGAVVTVTDWPVVLPHEATETRYVPSARWKVAIPALSVTAVELAPPAVTLTSVLAMGLVGVFPPGSGGPPAWITVTRSVPTGPDDTELPAWLAQPAAPAAASAIASAVQANAGENLPGRRAARG